MDTALPQKFPFILNRNLAKANCTGNRVCTSCDTVVLGIYIYTYKYIIYFIMHEWRYCKFYGWSLLDRSKKQFLHLQWHLRPFRLIWRQTVADIKLNSNTLDQVCLRNSVNGHPIWLRLEDIGIVASSCNLSPRISGWHAVSHTLNLSWHWIEMPFEFKLKQRFKE